jgi:peptidoglycan-N-acetylglucosamine deacetylase
MIKQILVTTSWDDGYYADSKLSDLLFRYNLKGTFYIAPLDHEFSRSERLSKTAIKTIAKKFEIGAHTMTHPDLKTLSLHNAYNEILTSKNYLTELTGNTITAFSYPYGRYTTEVAGLVERAGFLTARTTKDFITAKQEDPFTVGTTFEFCPQTVLGIYGQYKKVIKNKDFKKLSYLSLSWEQNARGMFDYVLEHGGVYHLWGHSQVIEHYNLWDNVQSLFSYIAHRKAAVYLTNSEVIQIENAYA